MSRGDEAALGLLYDRWSLLVHSMVLKLLGNADDTEEVVGDVFWQAWRQCDRYTDARGAVSTWLIMMARSRALDRLRTRQRRQSPIDVSEIGWGTTPNTPLQDAVAAERQAVVREAMSQLPEEQRQALELAFFGGLSHSEIAAHTGQPLGTVKTRVRLAVQKLKDRLSFLHEEPP